ncbi:DNA-binding transcriptional LysR family regulator [Limimaricola variabilis]|jgi:DNA-binding transcriptional LysR family regulator|uniref:DNA-binding transcriptional LysR family regulator n=1 Tax=Limimaricola variabilis TaxID=1492771 RepID=A0ABR6HQ57_9RHOB|nr:LysR family transcriptional regulator [Limimaricola variabilis]MBB3712671.1 DNA-binding transcriptional LysR family regulator [Limimaricola variabilis]WPY93412.1 LysR family transcriptional regulator [Limimaricola variabilis]
MDNWDEIRTAYHVARLGTVSGAAEVLGVHHATVIRHVDALETRLGVKLFQRHPRGYTATEAGRDLLQVAQTTDDQFAQLVSRLRGQGDGVEGELAVTTLDTLADLVMPLLIDFQADYPAVMVRLLTGTRLFRLEYGEAHIAIRAGAAPDQPDNVVQPLMRLQVALVAARSYIARHGLPEEVSDLPNHRFVCADDLDSRAPFYRWLRQTVPTDRITFRAHGERNQRDAVLAGAGLGFVPLHEAQARDDLTVVHGPLPEWEVPIWVVTHVDLHRTPKVQAFLKALKTQAKDWS